MSTSPSRTATGVTTGLGDAFLDDICQHPGDDAPRRIYADWLRERDAWTWETVLSHVVARPDDAGPRLLAALWCETEGRRPERGAFIRVQCELAATIWPCSCGADGRRECQCSTTKALGQRERELLEAHWAKWLPLFEPNLVRHDTVCGFVAPDGSQGNFTFRRGFAESVLITCAAFAGGPCGPCGGIGSVQDERQEESDALTGRHPMIPPTTFCPDCRGTGRTEGVAGALFRAAPLTQVVLSDKQPSQAYGRWCWFWGIDRRPDVIPKELWGLLPHREPWEFDGWPVERAQGAAYATEQAALSALSAACLLYGRRAAWPCPSCEGKGMVSLGVVADPPAGEEPGEFRRKGTTRWPIGSVVSMACPVCRGTRHAVKETSQ